MNITQILLIAKKLYPNKNIYNLTKEEKAEVMRVYNDHN